MKFSDDENNNFEFESITSVHDEEIEIENDAFYADLEAQSIFVETTLNETYEGESLEILKRAILDKESPEALAKEYGINSRVTITTRNRRARKKIKKALNDKISLSKMIEDKTVDGSFALEDGNFTHYCNRKNGNFHGLYQKIDNNGVVIIRGNYSCGNKVGYWYEFDSNSQRVKSRIDYDSKPVKKELWNRFGAVKNTIIIA